MEQELHTLITTGLLKILLSAFVGFAVGYFGMNIVRNQSTKP